MLNNLLKVSQETDGAKAFGQISRTLVIVFDACFQYPKFNDSVIFQ